MWLQNAMPEEIFLVKFSVKEKLMKNLNSGSVMVKKVPKNQNQPINQSKVVSGIGETFFETVCRIKIF